MPLKKEKTIMAVNGNKQKPLIIREQKLVKGLAEGLTVAEAMR
jgi:hypothetical protein